MIKAGLKLTSSFSEVSQETGQTSTTLRYAISRSEWQVEYKDFVACRAFLRVDVGTQRSICSESVSGARWQR